MRDIPDSLNTSLFDVNFMVVRVIILFFISSHSFSSLHSQSTLAAESSKTFFLKEVKEKNNLSIKLKEHFSEYQLYEIDPSLIKNWMQNKSHTLDFILDFNNSPNWEFQGHVNDLDNVTTYYQDSGQLITSDTKLPILVEGKINGDQNSIGTFTVNDGYLSGWVHLNNQDWYIENANRYVGESESKTSKNSDQYIIYNALHVIDSETMTCGNKQTNNFDRSFRPKLKSAMTPFPNACLDFMAVADRTYFNNHGVNTINEIVSVFNIFNSLYQNNAIGIDFQLTSIVLFSEQDPYTVNFIGQEVNHPNLLDSFIVWRNTPSQNVPTNDIAQLFSGHDFFSGTIGFATIGTICDPDGAGINQITHSHAFDGGLLAHEVGHNLGANHDPGTASCPASGLIMASVINLSSVPTVFSSCSQDYFEDHYTENGLPCSGCTTVSCSITDVAVLSQTICNPNTYEYSQTLEITYSSPPNSGYLIANNQNFPITGSPQQVVLDDLYASNDSVSVAVWFSDGPYCGLTLDNVYKEPASCAPCFEYNKTGLSKGIAVLQVVSDILTITEVGQIANLEIIDLDISDYFIGTMWLNAPDGTEIEIVDFSLNCSTTTDLDVNFDDDESSFLSCPTPANSSFKPLNPLTVLNGKEITGDWTLSVLNQCSNCPTQLNGWGLKICGPNSQDPCSLPTVEVSGSISSDTYQARSMLSSDGSIPSGTVIFRAPDEVNLEHDFSVASGSVFEIQMQDCTNN